MPRRPRARLLALAPVICLLAAVPARAAAPRRPDVEAPEAYLVDTATGQVLYRRRANAEVAIASTTKLMTAYVTLEREPLERNLVEQPYYPDSADQSLAHLPSGVRYSVATLLRAMLVPSGDDVANSLAIDVGGTIPRFVRLMNRAAARLSLGRTHYTTPIGLDTPGNYSTARDLEVLALALMRDPFFAAVVRDASVYVPGAGELVNTNDLLGSYPWVVGIKTGHTEDAGYCLVGAASSHGVNLISVVLGDPSEAARDDDTLALLRYGLARERGVPQGATGDSGATGASPITARAASARRGAAPAGGSPAPIVWLLLGLALLAGCSLGVVRWRSTETPRR
ncbi:MAG TPA: serine hydrolase [Solirubrobacteraceae bacterium]|nr:serine hydrolase [Solirubrobacteraceae bacterium]